MKTVFLIWATDAWHTTKSKELIGISSNNSKYWSMITEYIKDTGLPKLSTQNTDSLVEIKQTQGRDTNFQIEEVELNTLL